MHRVSVIDKYTVNVNFDGTVTWTSKYGLRKENLPYEEFKEILEEAEGEFEKTRKRFSSIIKK